MNFCVLFFLLQGAFRFLSASSFFDENRDLEREQAAQNRQLELVSSSDDEENDLIVSPSPPVALPMLGARLTPLTVSSSRFASTKAVTFSIFYLCHYLKFVKSVPIKVILGILASIGLFFFLQIHFAVHLTYRITHDQYPWVNIRFNPIQFSDSERGVSYQRWLLAPLLWLNEILVFMPDEAFSLIQLYTFLPSRSYLVILFLVQFLHHRGAFDIFSESDD